MARAPPGETPGRRGALDSYDESIRKSFVWKDLWQVRNMRPAFGTASGSAAGSPAR